MKHLNLQLPIKFYHLDFQDHISLPSLVNLLFEASGEHAQLNGFGIDTIRQNNISWIVGRIGIYLEKPLLKIPHCEIETWIDRTVGPSTLRKFRIYDHQKQLLATACFTYAALDLTTRQPVNVKEMIGDEIIDTAKGADIRMPAKVRPIKGVAEVQQEFQVQYGDLDYNRHATTTKYLQWMLNGFPLEMYTQKYIRSIDVNFNAELFYQDEIKVKLAGEADTYTVELQFQEKPACLAKISWAAQ